MFHNYDMVSLIRQLIPLFVLQQIEQNINNYNDMYKMTRQVERPPSVEKCPQINRKELSPAKKREKNGSIKDQHLPPFVEGTEISKEIPPDLTDPRNLSYESKRFQPGFKTPLNCFFINTFSSQKLKSGRPLCPSEPPINQLQISTGI